MIRDIPTLKKIIVIDINTENNLEQCLKKFKMAITPYYTSLMYIEHNSGVVRLQAIPKILELHIAPDDFDDPLHEDVDSPVPCLMHRYPGKILFLVTHICSMLQALHQKKNGRR